MSKQSSSIKFIPMETNSLAVSGTENDITVITNAKLIAGYIFAY